MSAILFSAGLSIGIMEGPPRGELARAGDQLWKIFPLQLLAIAFVAVLIVRAMPSVEGLSPMRRRFEAGLAFVCVFFLLLIADYFVGVFAFDRVGLRVLRYLERP